MAGQSGYKEMHLAESARQARIALARLDAELKATTGSNIEADSVYGAAFAMPQFARSAGWPPKLCILALRSYLFLFVNVWIQWFMVYSLMKEELVMDKFDGQMYLCDFGAKVDDCPEGNGCMGPGGTRISGPRMYSFLHWSKQKFVKRAFMSVFPDRKDEIEKQIDIGEYGLESMQARYVCTFLFMMSVTPEFQKSLEMLKVLLVVPSLPETWIEEENGIVRLHLRGMPVHWKIINLIFVFMPKLCLWLFTCKAGTIFLLETQGIQNTIVNSTALVFVLNIDEVLFDTLATELEREMLEMVEGIPNQTRQDHANDEELLKNAALDTWFSTVTIPRTLVLCCGWWMFFLWTYYSTYCTIGQEGTYVSKSMYLPKSLYLSPLSVILPQLFSDPVENEPYWTMPTEQE